jgi:putative redox protein
VDIIERTGTKPVDVVVRGDASGFLQEIVSGPHRLRADEPVDFGGDDAAPGPYDYVPVGLGACTSMTVGLYARRKKWPLQNISVSLRHSRIHAKDCAECETKDGMLDRIDVEIALTGALASEQRAKLMEIAAKCPVHRTLKSEINIRLRSAPSGSLNESAGKRV